MFLEGKDGEPPLSAAHGDEPTGRIAEIPLEAFLDPFIDVDQQGAITGWNAPAASAFGWTHTQVVGHTLSELLTAPSGEAIKQSLANLLGSVAAPVTGSQGPALSRWVEATAVHRDGHEFPIEMSFFPTRAGQGCRIGALARHPGPEGPIEIAAAPVTDESFWAIAEQLSVPLAEFDLRGNYLFVNQAYCDIYQAPRGRVGQNYKAALDPSVLTTLRHTYKQIYQTGQPAKLEFPLHLPDGRLVFIESFVALKRNSVGEPVGFISVNHDCTERKQYEADLAHAKDAAEAASRSKSEFLANMSHEIRTPLNGVLGMLELARCTDLDPEQRDLLGMAQDSANSLLAVLNDILDFSKIEAGKLEFEHTWFDLPETVAEAMRTVAIRAHEKRLELAYHLAPDVPQFIVGDPSRFKQVLINLIGNGIKFTERGEVVLKVERVGLPIERNTVQLKFSVSDTGIGIPEDKRKLIFSAFSQADTSTTRKYGGTGLGLAICSRLVTLMGGEIGVESTVGVGSTFHFTAGFSLSPDEGETLAANNPPELAGLPVLIVDDNATNRGILQTLLSSWGMLPVTAESGAIALQILQRKAAEGQPFTMALLDFQMPDMNGARLVQQTRDRFFPAPASIVMLTSDDYTESAQRCREVGVSAYLMKPIKQSELMSCLTSLLRPDASGLTVPLKPHEEEEKMERRNILLAEDNLVNQKLAVRLLQKLGHVVVIAATGREALEKLEQQSFDLVLMDVQMPDMDGFAATAAIRKKESRVGGHMPIIAMTAHAMSGDRQICLEAGMDDYISKPINFNQVRQVIGQVMRAKLARVPESTTLA